MGWNSVRQRAPHPIFDGIPDDSYFYFVHSYYPEPDDESVVIGETEYGVTFASVLARDNIVATQFHPEKSGEMGLRMYGNFLAAQLGRRPPYRSVAGTPFGSGSRAERPGRRAAARGKN